MIDYNEIYLLRDDCTLESDNWIEQTVYIISNRVTFECGKSDLIKIPVLAKDKYKACDVAKDFLLSRKAYNVIRVDGQDCRNTDLFLLQKRGV